MKYARRLSGPVGLLLAVIVGLSWAVASPPGASPDDDFHLASVWCAWGAEEAGCTELAPPVPPSPTLADVPDLAILAGFCTAFQPQVSAGCVFARPDGTSVRPLPETFPVRVNDGAYPGGYYSVMRLLVGPSTETSIVAMRLATLAICLGLFVLAGIVSRSEDRWRFWLYSTVASVPLALFIFASTNPSAWAMAGTAATFPAALAALRSARLGGRAWPAALLACGAIVIAVSSRSDAFYFCGLALVCALVIGFRLDRSTLLRQGLVVAPLGVALLLGRSTAASVAATFGTPATRPSLIGNVSDLPKLYVGEFATLLGWMDTRMPSSVWGATALAFGAMLVLGLGRLDPRRGMALGLVATVAVVLPLVILSEAGARVGEFLQPRYLLPVVFLLVGLLSIGSGRALMGPDRSQALWVAGLAVVAHTVALHVLMRRYINGVDVEGWNLNSSPEWWWDVPVQPMAIWALGSAAFAALALILAVRTAVESERTPQQPRSLADTA